MLNRSVGFVLITAFAALTLPRAVHAEAQEGPGAYLAGGYRCQPEPLRCSGPIMWIAQTGTKLELKDEQGVIGDATLTSDITVSAGPTMNAIGIVLPDHSIQWSNGTHWHKL
jgi:hypothetical protein